MLKPIPKLTKKEESQLVLEIAALTTAERSDFMGKFGLPQSISKKKEVRDRILASIKSNKVSYEDIVGYLDLVAPVGKQHVYLFRGPNGSIQNTYKKKSWVETTLAKHAPDIHALIGSLVFIGLPDKLTPTSIDIDNKHIRLTLVRRRAWSEHDPEYDKSGKTHDGESIEFRAFVNRVIRNYIAFEWDLVTNTAVLRISQLQGGMKYENVRKEFDALVAPWLMMNEFVTLDLHAAIVKLLEMERGGNGITRTHGFDIHSLLGRSIAATSNATDISVFGEKSVDDVFDSISTSGTGNHGNFYWLPAKGNPLTEEIRIVLVGSKSRVNFTSPSSELVIRHVLSEIRKHC